MLKIVKENKDRRPDRIIEEYNKKIGEEGVEEAKIDTHD